MIASPEETYLSAVYGADAAVVAWRKAGWNPELIACREEIMATLLCNRLRG
jgi:hypothetical protein